MKKPRLQQRGERRIAAALRIALAAALLAVQVLFVVLTTRYLKDHFALIYGALEGIALITALYIYNKPGDLSYRVAWIIPILFVPVVGLILYLLWGGDTQRKRLQRQTAPKLPPEEPESLRNRSALNADRLQRALPGWSRVSQYLSSRGFYLYQNTKAVYLPEGGAAAGGYSRSHQSGGALHLHGVFYPRRGKALGPHERGPLRARPQRRGGQDHLR